MSWRLSLLALLLQQLGRRSQRIVHPPYACELAASKRLCPTNVHLASVRACAVISTLPWDEGTPR